MDQPLSERIRTPPAPPELSYPGLSPQVLARVRQLWSARGLDLDRGWHRGVRALPGFRPVPGQTGAADSAPVDRVFLFDQALIWVRALHEAAAAAHAGGLGGIAPALGMFIDEPAKFVLGKKRTVVDADLAKTDPACPLLDHQPTMPHQRPLRDIVTEHAPGGAHVERTAHIDRAR